MGIPFASLLSYYFTLILCQLTSTSTTSTKQFIALDTKFYFYGSVLHLLLQINLAQVFKNFPTSEPCVGCQSIHILHMLLDMRIFCSARTVKCTRKRRSLRHCFNIFPCHIHFTDFTSHSLLLF